MILILEPFGELEIFKNLVYNKLKMESNLWGLVWNPNDPQRLTWIVITSYNKGVDSNKVKSLDIYGLDGNKNGIVCEALPRLKVAN